MALQECGLNLNRNYRELQPHGTLDFPCAGFLAKHQHDTGDVIPWHWHEEFEIVYLKSGRLRLQIPGKTFHLEKEDFMFVNSNILHYARAETDCEINSMVFHATLITGQDNSVFAKKYITPLSGSKAADGCHITSDLASEAGITNDFKAAFDAIVMEPPGYEFIIRGRLSNLCFSLYRMYEQELETGYTETYRDSLRVGAMLKFIHGSFSETIGLAQIARSANIGERECLRCFQRKLQISPMQYLIKYRVSQGAILLLQNPGSSISEISIQCGFDSPSNFSQMFKRFFKCTPREYRKGFDINC